MPLAGRTNMASWLVLKPNAPEMRLHLKKMSWTSWRIPVVQDVLYQKRWSSTNSKANRYVVQKKRTWHKHHVLVKTKCKCKVVHTRCKSSNTKCYITYTCILSSTWIHKPMTISAFVQRYSRFLRNDRKKFVSNIVKRSWIYHEKQRHAYVENHMQPLLPKAHCQPRLPVHAKCTGGSMRYGWL